MNERQVIKATLLHLDDVSVLFNQYRVFYQTESDIEGSKKFLRERMTNNESEIFISFNSQNQITGFAQLYPLFSSTRMKRLWLLNDLFVLSEFRGQGFSKLLIERAKELCRQTKACSLNLETAKTNALGNRLYLQEGFVVDGEHNYYAWDIK